MIDGVIPEEAPPINAVRFVNLGRDQCGPLQDPINLRGDAHLMSQPQSSSDPETRPSVRFARFALDAGGRALERSKQTGAGPCKHSRCW
jgi:hypothetical protein